MITEIRNKKGQFIEGQVAPRKGIKFIFPNMTGKIFGRWTVLEEVKKGVWFCKCECGTERALKGALLRRGKSKSCGCVNTEKLKQKTLKNNLAAKNKLFTQYKRNAVKRGFIFQLSKEEFISLLSGNCFYCGEEPYNVVRPNHRDKSIFFKYSGIDRLDNDGGYEKENVVSCCKLCNQAKMDLSYKDFILLINKIFNKHHGI